MIVNVREAKNTFSKLLARVHAGEEIVIAKAGKPVAGLVPLRPKPRCGGEWRGLVRIREDFDAPLPEGIERA